MKVELREVSSDDVEVFFEHQRDPAAGAMAAFPARELAAHRAHWEKILADPSCVTRTIVAGGQVAGNVGSWVQEGHREIGYWIGAEHWGKGIATAAVHRFLEVVVTRPLQAWVAEHNAGSIRVLEKCGFERATEQPEPEGDATRFVVFELRA